MRWFTVSGREFSTARFLARVKKGLEKEDSPSLHSCCARETTNLQFGKEVSARKYLPDENVPLQRMLLRRSIFGATRGVSSSSSSAKTGLFDRSSLLFTAKESKGFGRFFDRNKKPTTANPTAANPTADKPLKDSKSPFKNLNNNSNNSESNSNGPSMQTVGGFLGFAAAIGYLVYARSGGGFNANAVEIDWQTFKNRILSSGEVSRLVVVNKSLVRVYLRNPRLGLDAISGGAGSGDTTFDDGLSPKRSTLPTPTDAGGYSYYLTLGSIEAFEKKLEDAQKELKIASQDNVPVMYMNVTSDWVGTIAQLAPTVFFVGLWIMMMRGGMGGAGGGAGGPGGMNRIFSIGKSPAKMMTKNESKIRFADVAGCEEAKQEIMEFVDFLKDPKKFSDVGAKIPKGALLFGPPGTGKTLLAKAVAGEASVPFYSISGSDFIEMFVGVGPSRVRDLFKEARKNAPCIIFIDEIDAVARSRGKGGFGGNDERENTLNQLLVELDGFNTKEGVVVLAGTNRLDILDKAILRPGRFDRQIKVDLPDIFGRKAIFLVHLKQVKLEGEIQEDLAQRMAALTPGFSGAQIANVVNEAAILAAREARSTVTGANFDKAIDRVIGGLEKKTHIMSPQERTTVAYHEAGHAILGWYLEHADPLLKVTIIPRTSGALGFAQYLPKELALHTQQQLEDRMCMSLGGRAAEELTFGVVTTGARDDLDKVTKLAYAMVTKFGMSEKIGQLSFPEDDESRWQPYSSNTAQTIDSEVRRIVDSAFVRAKGLLTEHQSDMEKVAKRLLDKETITQHDIEELVGARKWKNSNSYEEFVAAGKSAAQRAAAGIAGIPEVPEPAV